MTLNRNTISKNKDYCTPPKYVELINQFFNNNIYLDPCSNKYSIINAKINYILPEDGLKKTWNYPTIFINPPYGRDKNTSIKDWLCKCYNTYINNGSEIIALVPVATNTSHWKNYIWNSATAICFLYDTRLKFLINGKIENKGAPMACALIYWGNNINKFNNIFGTTGKIIYPNILPNNI